MADNKRTLGYRTNDPVGRQRPPAPADTSNDPLAELARLIGQQNESYSTEPSQPAPAPEQAPRATPAAATPRATAPRPAMPRSSSFESRLGTRRSAPEASSRAAGSAAGYPADPYASQPGYDDRYSDPQQGYSDYGNSSGSSGYAAPSGDAAGYGYSDPDYQDQAYPSSSSASSGQGYQAPRYPSAAGQSAQSGYRATTPRASAGYPESGYRPQSYARGDYAQAQAQDGYDARSYGRPSGYSDPYVGEPAEPEDDAASPRRRRLATVAAVFALAVVGTAGAYGIRSMMGGSKGPVPPPVIEADSRPTKIVPANDSAKPIQDRVGAGGERVVSREETPVELRDPARAGQPRVIYPNPAGQQASAGGATGSTPAAITEPKKVRTVTIRPDMSVDTSATPQVAPSPRNVAPLAPAADPEPEPTANSPLALAPSVPTQAPVPTPTPAPARPQGQSERQASRTPAASGSPFPAPISSGTAAVSGAYAVQVTSQRSEADARASYRALQQQFPSVLGNRQPVIRRADLGEKGTYYRAQIPFSTQSEASSFCNSLKAAGGQCVVQRN